MKEKKLWSLKKNYNSISTQVKKKKNFPILESRNS